MTKITLPDIASGYNLSAINSNFQKIEDELNSKVLYRDSTAGEPNNMSSNLDMNSRSILNANKISGNVLEIGGVPVVPTDLAIYYYNETREALRRSYAEAGYNLVAGSFEAGGTLVKASDVLLYEADGKAYSWGGVLPKVVPSASAPASTGGIYPAGDWSDVGDATVRAIFSGPDHAGLNGFYGGGGWTGPDASTGNIYNSAYDTNNNAMRWRYDIPETGVQLPIAYLKKTIKTTRDTSQGGKPGRWDEGTLYSHVTKTGGTAFAAGMTSMFDAAGGSGDSVSFHARANGRVPHVIGGQEGSGVWGLWSFTIATPSDGTFIKQALGQEINLVNNGMPMPFPTPAGQGNYIGSFVTALNNVCSHGVEIGGGLGGSWNRGLFIRQGAITPSATYAGTTAFELEGGTFGNRYGGIKFGKGYFDYGINLAKPSEDYANFAAIILGDGNRIYMGDSSSAANYIAKVVGQPQINFQNMTIAVSGTKVIGTKQTGIFQMSGTADGTSIATDTCTLQQLARYVKKVSDALITHGMIGPT